MKKILIIICLVICFSCTSVFAMYKIMKEKNITIDVECVEADTFIGTASEIYKNIKTSKCGIKVDEKGLTFVTEGNGNYAKYNNTLYFLNVVKKSDYIFLLTNNTGARLELDPLNRIVSGKGEKNNPYIIK
ncbi:MAG: hypothetical protein IJI43_01050 [Bacilli bacterium]|nr:hypothetical protein [Bacilli bacterium]